MKKTFFTNKILTIVVGGIVLSTGLFLQFNLGTSDYSKIKQAKKELRIKNKIARDEYFFKILRDPATNSIPADIREKELKFAAKLDLDNRGKLQKSNAALLQWTEAGPTDVGGRTRALAVDRNNSNIVLAGGVNGGVWKSTDNGATWVMKSDPKLDLSVSYICQDPNNSSVWYYSAGELDQSAQDRGWTANIFGSGIYKSTDNGETWTHIIKELTRTKLDSPTDFISKILVSKATGSVFFAGGYIGIYKSTDGGATFNKAFGAAKAGAIKYYEFDIAANGTIVAATSMATQSTDINGGVYVSTDDGANWKDITPSGYNSNYSEWSRSVVAIAPSDNNVAYVWTDALDNNGDPVSGFFKFDLSTSSYTSVDRSANLPDFGGEVGNLDTQGSYNMILAVKPDDPDFVLLGATNLFRSFDGFATPANVASDNWIGGYATSNDIAQYNNQHPDQHALFFDPNDPNKLWSGHDGGLSYIADINEKSLSIAWENKNSGYNVTQFYKVAIGHIGQYLFVGGGTQDNGSPVFKNDDPNDKASVDISSGDGAYMFMGDNFIVASSQNGYVSKQYPQGDWAIVSPSSATDRQFIHPYQLDIADENVMYYPNGTELWRNTQIGSLTNSDESDEGWNNLGNAAVTNNVDYITAMGMAADHTLYIGMSGESKPEIVKLANANTAALSTAQDVSISSAADGAYVHGIGVNSADANELIVVFSNYNIESLYYSSDGGANYTAVEGNLAGTNDNPGPSIRAAEIVTYKGTTYYFVATSIGVYSTTTLNGANTVWSREGEDVIGTTVTNDIVAIPSTGEIAAGTHGRGIFLANLNTAVSVDDDKINPNEFTLEQNYPNPFNPSTTIRYSIPDGERQADASVKLIVFDALGEQVTTLVNETKAPGNYEVHFDASGLASGIYFYTLQAGNFTTSRKMILMR